MYSMSTESDTDSELGKGGWGVYGRVLYWFATIDSLLVRYYLAKVDWVGCIQQSNMGVEMTPPRGAPGNCVFGRAKSSIEKVYTIKM